MEHPTPTEGGEFLDLYTKWTTIKEWMAKAKEQEAAYRAALLKLGFDDKLTPAGFLPEGTTKAEIPLPAGGVAKLSVSCSYERKVLEESLQVTLAQIPEAVRPLLFKYKPELTKTVYNGLTDEQKAIVDTTLTIKPGSPQLTVTLPAPAAA